MDNGVSTYSTKSATMTINYSEIISNIATTTIDGGGGGGIRNASNSNLTATLTINDSLISYNQAEGDSMSSGTGGGIWNGVFASSDNATSLVTLNNSTISHNQAVNGAGVASTFLLAEPNCTLVVNINQSAIHDNATFALQGDQLGNGGGVLNMNSTVNLMNSTLSGNRANGMPSVSTDYSGLGGGILNAGSRRPAVTNLVHTTVAGNHAFTTGGGLVTGLLDAAGAGSHTSIRNSLVAGNSATALNTNCSSQPSSVPNMFVSMGYNLDGDGTCNLSQPTDLPATDPQLGPLADNGGDTFTHALLPGSPVMDAIPVVACAAPIDQRGVTRPQGLACDVGAYEAAPELHVTKSVVGTGGSTVNLPLSGIVTYTIIVENNGAGLASSVALTDVLPTGVTFATGIMTGSMILPSPNTLTWGPWDVSASESYTISFTAVVTDNQIFAGERIINTVNYTSASAGSGSSQAAFTIAGQAYHYIYLPLVIR